MLRAGALLLGAIAAACSGSPGPAPAAPTVVIEAGPDDPNEIAPAPARSGSRSAEDAGAAREPTDDELLEEMMRE